MVRRYLQVSLVLLLLSSLLVPMDTFAKGGRGFSSGARSFSGFNGGSRTGGFTAGRSFSTPRSAPPANRGTFKPAGGFTTRYDSNAASAQHAQSSKSLYERANGIFNGGRTTTTQRVGPISQETIETRPSRLREVFNRYTTQPVTTYHDSFNPFFWLWLMDRGQHERDLWVYNHRDEMDQDRYRDLVRKDADLERRLNDLEKQGVAHDPSYTPSGVDQDLMYDDNHVQRAYAENQSRVPWGLFVIGLVGIALVYLIFFVPMFNPKRRAY
jgi:hypothetical protein